MRDSHRQRTSSCRDKTATAGSVLTNVPGIREENEARRRAEERARAAEERLNVMQEQYRKTLEDLQTYQNAPQHPTVVTDPRVEERALRAEGQVASLEQQLRTITGEREHARDLPDFAHAGDDDRFRPRLR